MRDGASECVVRELLGNPDTYVDGDADAGIDYSWEYHDPLSDDCDFIVAFASGAVAFSSWQHVPDPLERSKIRAMGRPFDSTACHPAPTKTVEPTGGADLRSAPTHDSPP